MEFYAIFLLFYTAVQCGVFWFVIGCVLGATVGKVRFRITCIFAVVIILIPFLTVDLEMY